MHEPPPEQPTVSTGADTAMPGSGRVLIFAGAASRQFDLPPAGEVLIGRADGADLRIDHRSVSRAHARLDITDGARVLLHDLGSHNGTVLNGRRLDGPRSLRAGDVITLGEVVLLFQRPPTTTARRELRSPAAWSERLAAELQRAAAAGRALTVFAIVPGASSATPSLIEAAIGAALGERDEVTRESDGSLLILRPGGPGDDSYPPATAIIDALAAIAPGARGGVATWPTDATDAGGVRTAARAAADQAAPGRVLVAAERPTILQLGEHAVVAADPAMVRLFALLTRLAPTELPVLVHGETGTGKEIVATVIHHGSARKDGPFVAINCAALPDPLIESELFGYDKGAFSGAVAAKEGRFEAASGGTLFLDEIGELSPAAQAKVLRALETRRVVRLGETRERPIDVRLVAATHRDLRAEMAAGRFRSDLYFRLGSATVAVPPLRERPRDIAVLARRFLDEARARLGRPPVALSPDALQALLLCRWPGNVRELRHVIEFVAAVAGDDPIAADVLPPSVREAAGAAAPPTIARLDEEIRALERTRMVAALEISGGNQSRAAELIGMPRRTFVTKLKEHGLGGRWRRRRPTTD